MTGSIILYVVFAGLILFMIGIAVFGSYKERNKKRIEITTRKTSNSSINNFYLSAMFKLDITIKTLEHDIKTFKPSIGKKTMKQISDDANKSLKEITSDKQYAELLKNEKYAPIVKQVIKELKSIKPTSWHKNAFHAVNIVEAKAKAYKTKNKELYKKIQGEMK